MASLRVFAQARDEAGASSFELPGSTVGAILDLAVARFGDGFAQVLRTSAIWVNGEPAERSTPVADHDEVAVIPPVSGG